MRLINTETLLLESFPDLRRTPPYAVLSHTWGCDADEASLQEMMVPSVLDSPTAAKPGFEKIRKTCQIALETRGLKYAWVDTCCIDKTSSAELSEAINSMFKWYQQAAICLAFLEDWEPEQPAFDHCRWWRRGWTLQELIAPRDVLFFDKTWAKRGDLASLCEKISKVSRIKEDVLTKERTLSHVPVAVRMSWASHRETSREEDIAYCLMGIFDINMAMLYGEGSKAFLRLQEEIIKTTPDVSLFAWVAKENAGPAFMGILASSPAEFSHCSDI
ncbi:heterokaryon incompatibility protein-domain-containing protein, partial [Schizothecium vesticola]